MTQYYDLVLFLIPVALAGISVALALAGVSLTVAIPVAGVVSMAVIGHAMFVRAPKDTPAPAPAPETRGFNSAD